jgi:hypothetical protein
MTRYQSGKIYKVGRRNLKIWGIYKCKWRDQKDCKGCPGQLKFKELKGLKCGYIAGGKRALFKRITRQKGQK